MSGLNHLLLLALLLPGTALATLSAHEMVKKSDAVRNPDRSFSLLTTVTSFQQGRPQESMSMRLYSRADAAGGQFRSLLRFISPSRDAGKLTLKSGRDLWLYDPVSQASVPISPQQRLLGQAANGDVVTANWAADYSAQLSGTEQVRDGDRQLRTCYHLQLTANHADVTYASMALWVDTADFKTCKAEFHAVNGSVLKTTYYRRYANILGASRPTEMVIIDGVNAGMVTVIRNQDFSEYEVPEAWLQRDYLPQFRGQ